jgi:hypothetical protein
MNEEEVNSHKQEAEAFYDDLKEIYCPAIGECVVFNSVGFRHLFYKSRAPRPLREQILRVVYIRYAPEVIAEAKSVYNIRVSSSGRITTYALAHKTESGVVIRVVLQRVGLGGLVFLSVMPHRRT